MMSNKTKSVKISDLSSDIDVLENSILRFDINLLKLLLKDKTTKQNIIWATTDYKHLGKRYEEFSEITPELITGERENIIQPRIIKTQSAQLERIKDMAEVFTPSWICNRQNNLIDAQWFNKTEVFNTETDKGWKTFPGKIDFSQSKKTWKKYVDARRMEITCGEAPYLVSRYDTVTGEKIPLNNRIGLLDRKLRVVNENTDSEAEWLYWAKRAFQSVYGYEYQGDNLLLARENLFFSFIEYYQARFNLMPDTEKLRQIALIIAWNIWQMDGLKYVVPNSCKPVKNPQTTLFDTCDDEEPCPGCTQDDIFSHTGVYCRIQDWRYKKSATFISIMRGGKNHDKLSRCI